ncbi:hypothetical protein D3C84_1064780 [compost metagenome]
MWRIGALVVFFFMLWIPVEGLLSACERPQDMPQRILWQAYRPFFTLPNGYLVQ